MDLIYKYYGFDSGLSALKNRTIGFNIPLDFNDPMEGRLWLYQKKVDVNFLDFFLNTIGVLCMTEDPLNPLMWSHYGQSHSGFVIGYDKNDPIFGPQRDCVFNIENGRVFYSSEFETESPRDDALNALQWMSLGMDEEPNQQIQQVLRHILLMKQECWSYEKEIRIIKLIDCFGESVQDWVRDTGNNFQTVSTKIAPKMVVRKSNMRLGQVAPASIKRVILGMRNPLLKEDIEIYPDLDLARFANSPGLVIEKAGWSDGGESMALHEVSVSRWGSQKVIEKKIIDQKEIRAISNKLNDSCYIDQNLNIVKYISGKIQVFWDVEL